jgi:hypothetical protein
MKNMFDQRSSYLFIPLRQQHRMTNKTQNVNPWNGQTGSSHECKKILRPGWNRAPRQKKSALMELEAHGSKNASDDMGA